MKKFLAILLAAMMLLATAGVAFAEGDIVEITNPGTTQIINISSHEFTAYQVFGGTIDTTDDGTKVLKAITWGNGINTVALIEELYRKFPDWDWAIADENDEFELYGFEFSAESVAERLAGNEERAKALAKILVEKNEDGEYLYLQGDGTTLPASGESAELANGYYLIVDTTDENTDDFAGAHNAALLQVAGDGEIKISVKTDKPTHSKKVRENQADEDDKTAIGDSNKSGLYTNGAADTNFNDVADYNIGDVVPFNIYSRVPDMTNFETYSMIFTDRMSAGLAYNYDMKVFIKNGEDWVPYELDEENPAVTTETVLNETTGEQEEWTKIVVTLDALKEMVDNDEIDVGAEIRLAYTAHLDDDAVIGLEGNPNYSKLTYSNNPDDENSFTTTPEDVVVVFTYAIEVNKTNANGDILPDVVFYLKDEDNKLYAMVEDGIFKGWTDTQENATELRTNDQGLFIVKGLDDGTYWLSEIQPLPGYNAIADIRIDLVAETEHNAEYLDEAKTALRSLKLYVDNQETDGDHTEDGKVEITVINRKGAQLPETGGIGTTLFYMFGGIMAAGSALMLVVRRRADAEEE